MPKGIVKFYDEMRNNGSIKSNDGITILLFYGSELENPAAKSWEIEGRKVTFDIGKTRGETVAVNIKLV